ncbi:unnamed protein product, partial [Ranitomeya imitator]
IESDSRNPDFVKSLSLKDLTGTDLHIVIGGAGRGVLSQTLQESGPGLVKPSQQLKLTCTGLWLSRYTRIRKQAPGKGLEWIGRIDTDGSTR